MEHPRPDAPLGPGQRPSAAVRVRKESRYAAQKRAKGDESAGKPPALAREEASEFEDTIREREPPALENDENGGDEEPFSIEDAIMTSSVVERDPDTAVVAKFPTAAPTSAFPAVRHRSEETKPLSRAPVKAVSDHPVLGAFLAQHGTDFNNDDIEKTNAKVLASMSEESILEEQRELMSKLNPKLIEVLKRRGKEKVAKHAGAVAAKPAAPEPMSLPRVEEQEALRNLASAEALTLPTLEANKLAWMYKPSEPAEASTLLRFDFNGCLVPTGAAIAPHAGLHHHGENPQAAGYTLKELFVLARSSVGAQRTIALKTLAAILIKSESPALKAADVRHRLGRLNIAVLLRCSLDDSQVSVLVPALDAINALIGEPHAEQIYEIMEAMHRGWEVQPTYSDAEELVDEELEGAELSDAELAREDPLVGLLRMGLLLRMRFLLQAHRAVPSLCERVRELLVPLARHSAHAALHVLECPGFLPLFLSVFIEGSTPDPQAVRVLRYLAQASRAIAEKLSAEGPILALNRYILHPSTTPEEEVLFRETMLFWRVCVAYGFNASLFLDLFPVLSSRLISRNATGSGATTAAAIFATGEALIHACAKSAGITWPQPLAFLDPALALIAELRLQANISLPTLSFMSSAMAYLAAYFEHCTTQPAYSESANAQIVRLHVIPLCLAPLTFSMINTLLMRAATLTSVNFTLEIFAICDFISVLALLCNRVRQVLPAYLAPILAGGAYESQGATFFAKLQNICVALCAVLPLPGTREELLSSASLSLRSPTRMLQNVFVLISALPPPADPTPLHRAAISFIPRLLPGDETFFADILAGIIFNPSFAGAKLALPLLFEFFLLRFCPDRTFKRSLALTSSDVLSRPSLMLPISQTVLPASADWLLLPLSQALEIVEKGDAITPRHVRAIRDLLPYVAAHPPGTLGGSGPRRETCILDVCKFFLLETELQHDSETGKVLTRILKAYVGAPGGPLFFDRNAPGAFALWLQLVEQYAASSFGDPVFSSYIYLFLTTNEPVEYRKALFVGQTHALAALAAQPPPLPLSAYLDPPDTDEAQLRALINAVADDKLVPPSVLYSAALHHVAAFLFRVDEKIDAWLRKELCRTVTRTWSDKPHALVGLLDADSNKGCARAERVKLFEESVGDDAVLKTAYLAALATRP